MHRSRYAVRLALVSLSLATLVACGANDNLLNTRKGEKVIAEWLERQDMPAESIACPSDIKMENGNSFLCDAVIANSDGITLKIRVNQTTDKGDIRLEHADKILPTEHVERGVAGQVKDQTGKKVRVDCGARVRMSQPGTTFECRVEENTMGANKAAAAPAPYVLAITIEDDSGNWQAQRL